jgi:hypothetical protein
MRSFAVHVCAKVLTSPQSLHNYRWSQAIARIQPISFAGPFAARSGSSSCRSAKTAPPSSSLTPASKYPPAKPGALVRSHSERLVGAANATPLAVGQFSEQFPSQHLRLRGTTCCTGNERITLGLSVPLSIMKLFYRGNVLSYRTLGGTHRKPHRWATAVNVKRLLPPRRSRGTSPDRLAAKNAVSGEEYRTSRAEGRNIPPLSSA